MPVNHYTKYNELPDHHYSLIGKVMVEFSNIDTLLSILLTRLLLSPDFLGRSYTDQLTISRTINAIKQALDVHFYRYNNKFISEEKSGHIRDVLKSVEEVQKVRNKFAHHNVGRHLDGISLINFSGKPPNEKDPTSNYTVMSEESLKNLYTNAYGIVEVLRKITETIREVDEVFILKELIRLDSQAPSAQR